MNKKSIYNFTYRRGAEENVIYNTYSKALVVLNDDEFWQYEGLSFTDNAVEQTLLDNRIIVDADFDEVAFMRYCHYRTKYAHETLHLTIAPTTDCNFGCPYCYENRRSGKMSAEVQDAVIAYISQSIDEGTNCLELTWYGGEPLLCTDIIESMSRKILDLTARKKCEVKMYIVTNGYLLTPQIVDMLDEVGVLKVQITLDGLKEHHDARRHLHSGKGTFDKIVENLALFEDSPIRVDIRMNVDNENCDDYQGLVALIDSLGNPNISVYPSPVEDLNEDKVNEVSDFMTKGEFESFADRISKETQNTGAASSVLDDRYCFCNAETENCFVVDELGNFYKCWDQVGRKEYACFNILTPEDRNYSNITKFISWDPFTDERCGKCVFLPVCFGGCKFQRINKNMMDCGFNDHTMKAYIEGAFFDTI